MKKKVLIVLGVLSVLFIVLFLFGKSLFYRPCPTPEKPKNVPKEAVWKGDCDGGSWVELVSINENKVRFKIYRDWNGELVLDADFESKDCTNYRITKNNWIECSGDFINGDIGIHVDCDSNLKCRLEPIYPAYYEEKLE